MFVFDQLQKTVFPNILTAKFWTKCIPVWYFYRKKVPVWFDERQEVPVWHTVSYRPTSSTGDRLILLGKQLFVNNCRVAALLNKIFLTERHEILALSMFASSA